MKLLIRLLLGGSYEDGRGKDSYSLHNLQVGRKSAVEITESPTATVCKRAALL
jgi:hypothetical protein